VPAPDYKFVVVDAGYFLVREIVNALRSLGAKVLIIRLPLDAATGAPDVSKYGQFIADFASACGRFQPQALITVNHLGFDSQGILTGLLEKLRTPALVWYVDSPKYILKNIQANVSSWIGVFVWEKAYLSWLREVGFSHVHYLPLATDPAIFTASGASNRLTVSPQSLVFVGDSMAATARKALNKLPPDVLEKLGVGAEQWQSGDLQELFSRIEKDWGLPSDVRADAESALTLIATRRRRVEFIQSLLDSHRVGKMAIFGDAAWKDRLRLNGELKDGSLELQPPADYYLDLPGIYRSAGAVLNLTGLQMPTALNQRCYDVPAAGGLLITDEREALSEQFNPGKEIIPYRTRDEMLDKWNFYQDHPAERQSVIEAGKRRVLQEHTYQHRMEQALAVAKRWFNWK